MGTFSGTPCSTYRAFEFLDAKVVFLLLSLPVGDDVEGGDDDGHNQEDPNTTDDQNCHPTN